MRLNIVLSICCTITRYIDVTTTAKRQKSDVACKYKSDQYYHDDADHLGVENMLKRIREIISSRT